MPEPFREIPPEFGAPKQGVSEETIISITPADGSNDLIVVHVPEKNGDEDTGEGAPTATWYTTGNSIGDDGQILATGVEVTRVLDVTDLEINTNETQGLFRVGFVERVGRIATSAGEHRVVTAGVLAGFAAAILVTRRVRSKK